MRSELRSRSPVRAIPQALISRSDLGIQDVIRSRPRDFRWRARSDGGLDGSRSKTSDPNTPETDPIGLQSKNCNREGSLLSMFPVPPSFLPPFLPSFLPFFNVFGECRRRRGGRGSHPNDVWRGEPCGFQRN